MAGQELASRLERLRRTSVLGCTVPVAESPRARLLGLALLGREEAGAGLVIPRCSSVHTFGMRFPLDLYFLDSSGRPLAIRHNVPAGRFAWKRGAAAVLERPSASR